MLFRSKENMAGIDVELAREACRRLGYKPVFQKIRWEDKDKLLEEGKVACLWGCFTMTGRKQKYLWAGPYLHSRRFSEWDSLLFSFLYWLSFFRKSFRSGKRRWKADTAFCGRIQEKQVCFLRFFWPFAFGCIRWLPFSVHTGGCRSKRRCIFLGSQCSLPYRLSTSCTAKPKRSQSRFLPF